MDESHRGSNTILDAWWPPRRAHTERPHDGGAAAVVLAFDDVPLALVEELDGLCVAPLRSALGAVTESVARLGRKACAVAESVMAAS